MSQSYEELTTELKIEAIPKYQNLITRIRAARCPKHKLKFVRGRPLFMEYTCVLCGAGFIEPRNKFVERFIFYSGDTR